MDELCAEQHLLSVERGVIRVPFLIKGRLVSPPAIERDEILAAFAAAGDGPGYVKLPEAQVIRLPAIARDSMRATPEYIYHVLPNIRPLDLIETDFDELARGPYALTVDAVLDYLESIAAALQANPDLV